MKKTAILLILLLSLSAKLFAQQHVVDSILNIVNNKSIPFEDRYKIAGGSIASLSYLDRVPILLALVSEAKQIEEKRYLIWLYSNIVTAYALFKNKEAELYVDSLFQIELKYRNPPNSARIHYAAGLFYKVQGHKAKACEHLYIAADNYSKYKEGVATLLYVYSNIADILIDHESLEELEALIEILKQQHKPNKLDSRIFINRTSALYFSIKYKNDQTQIALLDSSLFYSLLINEDCNDFANITFEQQQEKIYNDAFLAYLYKDMKNTNLAMEYLMKYKKAIDVPNSNPYLISIYYILLGQIYLSNKDYNGAQINIKRGLKDLQSTLLQEGIASYTSQITCYTDLSLACEGLNDYKSALEYERLRSELAKKKFDAQTNDLIQKYQTEYEVEGKKREIATLTTLNESEKQIKNLYLGIFILSVVILLLSTWWFVTKRRIAANELQIVKLKKDEAELQSQLETERASVLSFKIEEQDREYKELVQAKELEQYTAYIDGLEVERTRLAKELHDNVANEILAIGMSLHAQADKQQIDTMLNKLGVQVRNISHELIPPVFNLVNLFDNLTDYVAKLNNANNNLIVLNASPNIDWEQLPANYASELYRITQEACSNSLKYAEASQIKIDLEYNHQVISLTISDNGNGFDTSKPVKGIGLRTMQIRANSIGALFSVKSQNGEGTQVQLTCDIRQT